MKYEPHDYQRYCTQRIIDDAAVGLMLDMGLGKSVITLTAIDELMYNRMEVDRVLIIAPKKVAQSTWSGEAAKWDHTRHLRMSLILGSAAQRERALAAAADVYVINRDNVKWLVEKCMHDWPFDMVVVDESSSFKDARSKRWRALKLVLPRIRRMVLLTGTPAPNGLEDLWAQVYLLDRGQRLGKTLTWYREMYFDHNVYTHEYKERAGANEKVRTAIADICISLSAKDLLNLPEFIIADVPVALDAQARKAYRDMERNMLLELDETTIEAVNAAALTGKLLQLASGEVYDDNGQAQPVHTAKLDAFSELIEGLNGEHALVFYSFRHEIPRVEAAIRRVNRKLRVRKMESPDDERAWNAGEVDILLAHPASAAYGLNLQQGGHHVIWLGLPWSLELYQQANARLWRQGQAHPVIAHRLLVTGSVDEDVATALDNKRTTQDALLNALKARIRGVKVGEVTG